MHKLEVYVIDFEDYGPDEAVAAIEGNDDVHAHVKLVETADIGEWHDNHHLNFSSADVEDFRQYFHPTAEEQS
jgi:hypothetical protein